MGQVTVTFNNQDHHLACQDGGEERLKMLADYINQRASSLIEHLGSTGDTRLLLMTAIMIADELHELNDGELPSHSEAAAEVKRMDVAMGKAILKIEEMAKASGMAVEQLGSIYKSNENIKQNLMYAIREEKTFEKLLSEMKVK